MSENEFLKLDYLELTFTHKSKRSPDVSLNHEKGPGSKKREEGARNIRGNIAIEIFS